MRTDQLVHIFKRRKSLDARSMTNQANNIEEAADRRADRRMVWFIGLMLAVSLIIQASTVHTEALRTDSNADWREAWIKEASSHLVIFLLAPLVARVLSRAPINLQAWRWSAPTHLVGVLGFSIAHVVLMFAARKVLFPVLLAEPYSFNLLAPANFFYEFKKDIFTYGLLVFGFVTSRSLEQRRLELKAALETARGDKKLTLKSGGSTIMLHANDIIRVQAAGNYVEVVTASKTFLARHTLAAIERLLTQADDDHIRVHRSHLVRKGNIVHIKPTGEGDVKIEMSDGAVIPGSRRYRDRLPSAS